MNIYLYENHNYFNRQIKRYETGAAYEENMGESPVTLFNVAFNPNDGISTTQIVTYDLDAYPDYAEGIASPSYCVVVEDDDTVSSRWWVVGSTRKAKGLSELTLIRDLVADYYWEIMECPSFINKGYPQSVNDPAIFNNEDLTFNQIKTAERFIKDKSEAAWYVGYISKDVKTKSITVPAKNVNTTDTYDSFSEYPFSKWTAENPFIGDYSDITFQLYGYTTTKDLGYGLVGNTPITTAVGWDINGRPKLPPIPSGWEDYSKYLGTGWIAKLNTERGYKLNLSSTTNNVFTAAGAVPDWKAGSYALTGAHTESATSQLLAENGRFIRIDGVAYKVKVVNYTSQNKTVEVPNSNVYAEKFKTVARTSGCYNTSSASGNIASISYTSQYYYVTLEEVNETGFTFTIPENRQHTAGVPYDIFAIPATFVWLNDENLSLNNTFSQACVNAINTDMVGGVDGELYDIQLLPYCPINDEYLQRENGYGRVLTDKMQSNEDLVQYQILEVAGNDSERTVILYAESAEFEKVLSTTTYGVPNTVEDFKVDNETNMYRLCSPNYNGQFEFSVTKNGGVSSWRIACTYKPYTPYIRVAPNFGRLYGKNFFDARGLILGGDFSIAQTNEAWLSYELQNKNYQVMFDRQITNMEVTNRIQKSLDIGNAITGSISGGAAGAGAGYMMSKGNPWGLAIGAAVGTATSAAGGITDVIFNEKLRREQISFAKDQFGYQMQNIQALPYSLTKVGSQNADFKHWPFVEYYTCTETEKRALRDKLNWNGYTIGRIGRVKDFLKPAVDETGTFVQAKPLRLEIKYGENSKLLCPNENSRVIDAISAELQTGVYFV